MDTLGTKMHHLKRYHPNSTVLQKYSAAQLFLTLINQHIKALSHGTRQSRVSSSFSMGDMQKAANRKRFCWRRGGGVQAVLVHPKSCRFHEHGASRQAPPKIKIFYLFVSGSGSHVGFNQSENWLLTTTSNISLMKISVNPTGIPGVVWSIKISEI